MTNYQAKWNDLLLTLQHLEPPAPFDDKDILGYEHAHKFLTTAMVEIGKFVSEMHRDMVSSSGVAAWPTPDFSDMVEDHFGADFTAAAEVLRDEQRNANIKLVRTEREAS